MKKESYRDQLMKLKWEAFDNGDFKTVKLLRLKIKEYDRKHASPKRDLTETLAEQLGLSEELHERLRRKQYAIRG